MIYQIQDYLLPVSYTHLDVYKRQVTKSGRGAPRAPVRGDSHPAGGVGPACRSIRGRIRASTGPLGGLGPAATDVSSVARKERLCAAQLGIQKAFSYTLPRG